MYPGHTPDHEHGKAASRDGTAAAEAKADGTEIGHGEVEYKIGQARGTKRKTVDEIRSAKSAKTDGPEDGSKSGSKTITGTFRSRPSVMKEQLSDGKLDEAASGGDNPYFVIDTKPTPVNLPGLPNASAKRSKAGPKESLANTNHKKAKMKHEGSLPRGEIREGVQFEDISEEVEARLKEKDEKRRQKEVKKRKRESEGDPLEPSAVAGQIGAASEISEKPKKKKSKHNDRKSLGDGKVSKKRSGNDGPLSADGEAKKKKRKKVKETAEEG